MIFKKYCDLNDPKIKERSVMPKKMRWKILKIKHFKNKVRIRYFVLMLALFASIQFPGANMVARAESCPELKIIFVRGSGGKRWEDDNYYEFKRAIAEKMLKLGLSYDFLDLDYPAVGVGLDNLWVTVGALVGAGDAYEFGDSVNAGVRELTRVVNNTCPNSKFVVGGYSQGAMVISKALPSLNPAKIIYAATFGDPKIYLPEGAGIIPAACRGDNLSDYRVYVPDCRAYKGLLGSYQPYEPAGFGGKLGTWCNKFDIFCSSYFSVTDHVSYISDNLYEDASRMIAHKITAAFGLDNEYVSPHDTAILIDSSSSMEPVINSFKNEALRLAKETFESGGRVALYDYRDLDDPYEPVARCNFETCSMENFEELLEEIVIAGGGDVPESLLSASVKVMHELKWRRGATKSLVVLTDAPYLSPDRDKTTVEDVVELSKRIDPVNMYIITDSTVAKDYPEMAELAEATGGTVFTNIGELNMLTDYIMERYDSLPKVEEDLSEYVLPKLEARVTNDNLDEVTVTYDGEAELVVVILNDAVLGVVKTGEVKIKDLDRSIDNRLVLVPLREGIRGEGTEVVIEKNVSEVAETSDDVIETTGGTMETTGDVIEIVGGTKKTTDDVVEIAGDTKKTTGDVVKISDEAPKTINDVFVPKTPDTGVSY